MRKLGVALLAVLFSSGCTDRPTDDLTAPTAPAFAKANPNAPSAFDRARYQIEGLGNACGRAMRLYDLGIGPPPPHPACEKLAMSIDKLRNDAEAACRQTNDMNAKIGLADHIAYAHRIIDLLPVPLEEWSLEYWCGGLFNENSTFIDVQPSEVALAPEETADLEAVIRCSNGTCIGDLRWTIGDSSVAGLEELTSAGGPERARVTAKSVGYTTVVVGFATSSPILGLTKVVGVTVGDPCESPFTNGCETFYSGTISGYDESTVPYFRYDYLIEIRLSTTNGITEGTISLWGGLTGRDGYFWDFPFPSISLAISGNVFTNADPFNFFQHQGAIWGTIHNTTVDLNLHWYLWDPAMITRTFNVNTTLTRMPQP